MHMNVFWRIGVEIVVFVAAFGFIALVWASIIPRLIALLRAPSSGVDAEVRLPPLDGRSKSPQSPRLGALFYDRLFTLCSGSIDLVIEGRPQRAVALRFWTPGDREFLRIRTLIEGSLPGCETARGAGSSAADIAPDDWVAIAEFRLRRMGRPLRVWDEGDTIGPIFGAHRVPPDIRWVRTHVVLTPCARSWRLRWRRARLRAGLSATTRAQRQEHADDMRRIGAILQASNYWVTVRVVAVADDRDAAEREVRQIASVISSVIRRPEDGTARMTLSAMGVMQWHDDAAARRRAIRTAIIGAGCGLIPGALLMMGMSAALHPTPLAVVVGGLVMASMIAWGAATGAERTPVLIRERWERHLHGIVPTLASSPELASLWDATDVDGALRLSNRFLPPPDIAFQQTDSWVALGFGRRADGSEAPIGVTLRDMRQVLHITAGMGAGKSRLLANIVAQVGRMPVGMGIIDGKGDDEGSLAWLALDLLPMEREKDIIFLYPLEPRYPIALNPLQPSDADPSSRVNQLLALLARLDAGGWSRSHGMEQYAMHAGILVAEGEPHPTLMHVKRALIDDAYRKRLLPYVRNPETLVFWKEIYPAQGKAQRGSIDALIRRIDKVLAPEIVRWIFTSPRPTVNLTHVMEQAQIVIAPLPSERLGGIAYAFGILLTREIVLGAFLRSGSDMARTDWPLIIDEVQVLLDQTGGNDDFRTMLSRLRSLAVPGVYAHQALAQLGDLAPDMLVNAANRVILRTPTPDAETYARRYASYGVTAADIARQNPFEHQYFDLMCSGRATGIFSGRPLPWPTSSLPKLDPLPGASWTTVRARPCVTLEGRRIDERLEELMQIDPLHDNVLDVCVRVASSTPIQMWRDMAARWQEHCLAQREALLAEPRLEPNHRTRRRLISALKYGRPLVMAMIEYLYIRDSEHIGIAPRRTFAPSAYVNGDGADDGAAGT